MLRMNREEREDVLRCFLLLLQPLRRNSLLSTVPKSPFTNKQTSKQTNISKQPNKLFTKNNVPPSNLVEIRIAEVFSCLFLIEALSKWQLCSHPAPSHAAIPECSRTAQALVPKKEKNKCKGETLAGCQTPLQTDECPLLCPEVFMGDCAAWNGLGNIK